MNNRMLYPVMLLVGIAIGTGVGMLISKPKIDDQKKELDQLITQMQTAKVESEETIQRSATEIVRTKSLLRKTKAELARVKEELQKNEAPTAPDVTQPVVVITTPSDTTNFASTTPTVDYTIKEGDSFWKIAEEQLGDGLRYTEILKLNPDISENQTLTVGMKVKIPAE
jgi:nucleoid-associated protein YgaU